MRLRRTRFLTERPTFRRIVVALIVLSVLVASTGRAVAAGLIDPRLQFRQVRTEHFVIYFHAGEEPLARRLAGLVEHVRDEVSTSLGLTPPRLTHVILADQSEIANGWATPIPRDVVFLSAASPSGAEYIGRTDDWLRLVFTHEFSHVVHLDRSGSWAWLLRGVLGRSPIVFPNLWLPQFQVEGLATWEESVLTGEGRRAAGDFRVIERLAASSARPLSLDRSSGGLVGWPDGHAAYAAGLGFHEYLVSRFGQDSLGALATATSRRLPFFGTRAYRSIYGQSLGALWRDYVRERPGTAAPALPLTPALQLTHHGNIVVGPRFVQASCDTCPREVLYSSSTPSAFPSLRAVTENGADDRQLTTRYQGSTIGARGPVVVFDQQEIRRNAGLYSDLYALDRASGHVRALTHEARLQDPDVSPEGDRIVAVRERGGSRELVIVPLSATAGSDAGQLQVGDARTLASGMDTHYSAPRWSADGRRIAVERTRVGALPDVVVFDAGSGDVIRTFADGRARIVTPTWRPDGTAVVAAADFDGGPFDLYEFPLDEDGPVRRLTRTSGAIWPDVSPDSRTIVFAGYSAAGYDVYTLPYEPLNDEPRRVLSPAPASARLAATRDDWQPATYSPAGTLAPTSWSPYLVVDSDQTRIGASTGAADLLGRHAYEVSATWLVDGPSVVRPTDQAVPDWNLSYAYTRWRPVAFASVSRETVFRTAVDASTLRTMTLGGVQYQAEAGVYLPLIHVRRNGQLLASVVHSDARFRLPEADRDSTLVSARFAGAYDTSQRFGYSISRERGVDVGSTLEMARQALGSDADGTTATVDLRAYMPGLARQHVVALRAAGGASYGAVPARQSFALGEVAASPSVVDFGGSALGLLRGVPSTILAGDRVVVANAEYRLPLAVVERGLGTWPLMIRTIHASVFADAGRVGGDFATATAWARGFGGELSADAVAGYSLPFAASLGVAWGHDGHDSHGIRAYLRLGRAF